MISSEDDGFLYFNNYKQFESDGKESDADLKWDIIRCFVLVQAGADKTKS
jgi:hypothetical protein